MQFTIDSKCNHEYANGHVLLYAVDFKAKHIWQKYNSFSTHMDTRT